MELQLTPIMDLPTHFCRRRGSIGFTYAAIARLQRPAGQHSQLLSSATCGLATTLPDWRVPHQWGRCRSKSSSCQGRALQGGPRDSPQDGMWILLKPSGQRPTRGLGAVQVEEVCLRVGCFGGCSCRTTPPSYSVHASHANTLGIPLIGME